MRTRWPFFISHACPLFTRTVRSCNACIGSPSSRSSRHMCKIHSRVQAQNRRAFLISLAALAGGLGHVRPVLAQTDSSRPIRLLVPLAPGGATDPYARLIAEHMASRLGRVIIVEHKPGGSGNVGTQYAAHEPADGNLILLTTQAMTEINPSAFTNRKW